MTRDPDAGAGAAEDEPPGEGRVLSIHVGRSANCSSIGSFVDFLFASSVVGAALIGALAVSLRSAGEPAERSDADDRAAKDGEDRGAGAPD